jgi:sugar phosphate permease
MIYATRMFDPAARPGSRWLILALGIAAQAATCMFIYGLPMLVPALRHEEQLSLLAASMVISAPIAGVLLTLVAWGAAADHYGERVVMATGLALASGLLFVTELARGPVALCVLLGLAGAAGASVNAASGRVVMGWFPVRQRGVAMGARQTAQPLGVAVAALALPPLARDVGIHGALMCPAVLCALVAGGVLLVVRDPPRGRPEDARRVCSPYRTAVLWRIHTASALLVVPQFAVSAFTLVYLVGQRHWDPAAAGRLVFWFQLAGAAGRIGAGAWSDAVASRLRPMRQLAAMSAALMLVLAAGAWAAAWWVIVGFALGAIVTVADNGLGYTAVAELAGLAWAGRALGVQNTGQNMAAALTAPLLAAIIGDSRYALGFGIVVLFPLLAVPLTPLRAERRVTPRPLIAAGSAAHPTAR